jgi:Protein of unknown function (DUF3225)
MIINNPDVIAEPRELYPNYEAALGSNDVEKLVEMFWADPARCASEHPKIFMAIKKSPSFAKADRQQIFRAR